MHIPDGFLSTPVWLGLNVAGVPAIGYVARRAQTEMEETRLPLLGVMGAFVFAAQMINFPVGVGTSGHLVGAALLAITLGPAAAVVVMTAILAIQAFVFQDGGILALGANVCNMAICGVLAGYLPYRLLGGGRFRKLAIFLAGLGSVLAGAVLAITELRLSGVPLPLPVLWVSLSLFLLTGILEGAITLAVVSGIERLKPGLALGPGRPVSKAPLIVAATAVLLACAGVFVASSNPDGLEALAERVGIASRARTVIAAPLADYQAHFLESAWMSKVFAGLAGLALIYGACLVFGRVTARRRSI
jgi:cobalt/nickel transport system permease protein